MKKQFLTVTLVLMALLSFGQKTIFNRLNAINLPNHKQFVPPTFELKSNDNSVYHYENQSKQFLSFVFEQGDLQCVSTNELKLVANDAQLKRHLFNLKVDGYQLEVIWRKGRLVVLHNGKWYFYTQNFIKKQP